VQQAEFNKSMRVPPADMQQTFTGLVGSSMVSYMWEYYIGGSLA
jgi:hypothetical protein